MLQLDDEQIERRMRHARQAGLGQEPEASRDLSPPVAERPMSPPPGAAPHVAPGPPIWPSADEQFRVTTHPPVDTLEPALPHMMLHDVMPHHARSCVYSLNV